MKKEINESFLFERLKKIRLEKNMSLESISDMYRIQMKYLVLLEEGDLLAIPEVYDKMFFRSYVKALGLDEDDYYDEFIDYRRSVRLDKTTSVFDFSQKPESEKKYLNYRNAFVILPLLIVVIVVWILINNTEMIQSSSENSVNEINIQDVVRKIEQQEKMARDSIQQSKSIGDTLNLSLTGLRRIWFRVVIDAADTSEYLFDGGETIQLQAQTSFEFIIGRADGLRLNLNGVVLPSLGSDSSVVRYLKVDSSGIAAKIIKTD